MNHLIIFAQDANASASLRDRILRRSPGLSLAARELETPELLTDDVRARLEAKADAAALRTRLPFIVEDRDGSLALSYMDERRFFIDDPETAADALRDFLRESEKCDHQAQEDTACRWSVRAREWTGLIRDEGSYVHHESGYGRFDALLGRIMRSVEAPRCLDVGCGTGEVARGMAATGASSVHGIDVSEGMIAQARDLSRDIADLTFETAEIDASSADGTYDVIASRGVVLSHLPRRRAVDFLFALTRRSHEGSYAVIDFIQRLENGGFPNAGDKHVIAYPWLLAVMRELGWVPVARDGDDGARVVIAAFHRPFPDSRYFVSGNPQKLLELRQAARQPHLHACDFDLPELKHDDIARIAEEKARQAFGLVGRPVVSTDGGIFIDAYDGYPGPNSKAAALKLKPEGILRLMRDIEDRRGVRRNAVTLYDGVKYRTDVQEVPVEIATVPRGAHSGYPMDRILVPIHPENPRKRTYAEIPIEERATFTELPALAAFLAADEA